MNRSDILRARRAVNKAIKLCTPLVITQELVTIQYRLKKLLLDCPKEIRTREDTVKTLIRKADKIFSEYVRLDAAREGGTVECFTCHNLLYWTEIDNGHFIKRQYETLRFNKKKLSSAMQGMQLAQAGKRCGLRKEPDKIIRPGHRQLAQGKQEAQEIYPVGIEGSG